MGKNKKSKHILSKKPNFSDEVMKHEGDKFNIYIALAVIILITIIAYLPVFHNGLLNWDDEGYIKNNLLVHSFNLKEIFSQYVKGNWHPVTILILAIEYHFFGLHAIGYHSVNLLLHLINVVLVFYAVYYLSNKTAPALIAALLFGIHPLHVESVAWTAELKDLLYTLFFLASYILYLKYLKELKKKYYLFSLLLFFVSLLSKAMAASLPVVLILTDYFKGRKINSKVLFEKVPFFLLAIFIGVVALIAQKSAGAIDYYQYTFPQRCIFACFGFISYIFKLILPLNLSAYYPYPLLKNGIVEIPFQYYTYLLFFLILSCYVIYSLRFSKKIFFGIGFYAVTVFLVLQLIPVGSAIMADRYSYIPSIGIFYLAGEGFILLWNKTQKLIPLIVLSSFTIFFSVKTYIRCGVWDNDLTLWNDVISQNPNAALAYYNRGVFLMNENKNEEALEDYSKAIELNPIFTEAYKNRGFLFASGGKLDKALADYNKVIEMNPNSAEAYNNRGSVLLNKKRDEEALADFNKAIELNPGDAESYYNIGLLYMNETKNSEAIKFFNKAIGMKPGYSDAYNNRGIVFVSEKRNSEAIGDFSKVIELRSDFTDAYINRGIVFYNEKRVSDAIKDFDKAIEIKPGDAGAYLNRGFILMNEGRNDEALKDFNRAIELNPNFTEAYISKANLLFEKKRYDEAVYHYTKVIELMNNYAPAWYKMGLAKYYSGNKSAACNDLNRAAALGYKQAEDALAKICK